MRVVYLPGMSGASDFWQPVARRLPTDWTHIFLEWPGLGPVPASPTVRGFDDLVAMTRARLMGASALVAQSMGGAIAVNLALDERERVTHLVLAATSGGVNTAGASDWRPDFLQTWPSTPDWALEPWADRSAELEDLEQRTLLLWAESDPLSPLTVGTRLASLIPQADLEVVRTTSHSFAHEQPDLVAPLIELHLEK